MTVPVIIVDSEAKARTLQSQLPGEFEFLQLTKIPITASYQPRQGSEEQSDLAFLFSAKPEGRDFLERLLVPVGREVYLGLDCDEEGDLHSWLLGGFVAARTKNADTVKRLLPCGLYSEELRECFENAEPVAADGGVGIYVRQLFRSALSKQFIRLIGTANGPRDLPLTPESLAILNLLVERENEIAMYGSAMKWQVMVQLAGAAGSFRSRLEEAPGKTADGYFKDVAVGKEVVASFKDSPITVSSVSRTPMTLTPPSPYRLLNLLRDGHVLYGMRPMEVLEGARTLFDGIVIQGRVSGLISSIIPLGGCELVELAGRCRAQVEKEYGPEALGEGEGDQLSEESIMPIDPAITESDLQGLVADGVIKIYGLIRARALASQMRAAVGDSVDARFSGANGCVFHTAGHCINEKGYLMAYRRSREETLLDPCPLAGIEEGDTLTLEKVIPEQTTGFPAERYSYDTLFSDLDDFSMAPGRASVGLIDLMLQGGYIEIDGEGILRTGENAGKVTATLNRALPSMQGINFSAYLEQTMEEALSGRKELGFALRQFDQTMTMQGKVLVKADISAKLKARQQRTSSVIKTGQEHSPPPPVLETGKPVEAEPLEVAVPEIEAEVLAEQPEPVAEIDARPESAEPEIAEPEAADRDVGDGEVAEGVAGQGSEMREEPPSPAPPEPLPPRAAPSPSASTAVAEKRIMACPICHTGSVVIKPTPTGKKFYVCLEEDCEFMAWAKPHELACPVCDSPYLVEKRNLRGQTLLRCPRAGCSFMQPLAGGDAPGDLQEPVKKKKLVRRVARKGGKRKVVVRKK